MGRPRQITDEQIDAAARATFLEHGPTAPVSLVAAQLGVSHTALLQRAGSKEKLLLRALGPGTSDIFENLARPPPARQPLGRLEALLSEVLVFHEQMLPGLMVLRAGGLTTAPPRRQVPPPVLLRRLLKTWLVKATRVSARRAAALAEGLLGAIEARCFNAHLGGPAFVTGSSRRFVHLLTELVPELRSGRRS